MDSTRTINGKAAPVIIGAVAVAGLIAGIIWYKKKNRNVVDFDEDATIIYFPIEEKALSDEEIYDSELFEEVQDSHMEETLEPAETVNVFLAESDDTWNYELELSTRSSEEPYILHVDEFLNDEMDFKQETLTYYELDDIMADINDVPIYNWISVTGPLNWGHGSGDKNVVYVRNEKLRKEYEILKHNGSFETEVAGANFEYEATELKHSVLKFRDD